MSQRLNSHPHLVFCDGQDPRHPFGLYCKGYKRSDAFPKGIWRAEAEARIDQFTTAHAACAKEKAA